MKPVMKPVFASLFLLTSLCAQDPPSFDLRKNFELNLKDPTFSQGVLTTTEGGVIQADTIRIQAQTIRYTDKMENGQPIQTVEAAGDLMLTYGTYVFVGEKLDYDFTTHTGTLLCGRTFTDYWYLGGEKIHLYADGSYTIDDAFITTSENRDSEWGLETKKVKISKDQLLSARNIRFHFFNIPFFWLPAFKANLKWFSSPPIRYKLTWDKVLGPRISARYRVYSWENFDLFFRLDYRLTLGLGGAIETEYYAPSGCTHFLTKNYAAHDKIVPDESGNHRFRFQGVYHSHSIDEKTRVDLTYDRMSDNKMPNDFETTDFVLDTRQNTRLYISHVGENLFGTCSVQPRINPFQSINQELPLVIAGLHPFPIGKTGVLTENYFSAALLDYVFDKDPCSPLASVRAVRLETKNRIYRPIGFEPVTITPSFGVTGIFYNDNPNGHNIGQGVLSYGVRANSQLYRRFSKGKHIVEPYLEYQGYSRPTASVNDHYVFYLGDGFAQLNLIQGGIRNLFFRKCRPLIPLLTTDLYARASLQNTAVSKFYFDMHLDLPSFALYTNFIWNQKEKVVDAINARAEWTLNSKVAFGLEMRHRSKFDYRKADHENFFIDVAQPIDELLASPLSDGRDTMLAKLHIILTPLWSCHFQSRYGWGRKDQPFYREDNINVYRILSSRWRVNFGYQHTPDDDRFTTNVQLY